MPFHRRKPAAPPVVDVTIDGDGFIVLGSGDGLPFKVIEENLGDGNIRIQHVVKHPVHGEITLALQDIPE